MKKEFIEDIGKYCRAFRLVELELTLREVAELTGSNDKALSSFEHGRANNIIHLVAYVLACETEEQRAMFYEGLDNVIKDYVNEGVGI